MDPRERADATLARARARGAFVVTPESAVSPMDAASTLQIPRAVVDEADQDPETTMVVPHPGQSTQQLPNQQATQDELPAIAQEALTDVVTSPPPGRQSGRPSGRGGQRPAPRRPVEPPPPPEQATVPLNAPETPPTRPVAPEPEPEQVDGIVPTVKNPPTGRSRLSQRLDG